MVIALPISQVFPVKPGKQLQAKSFILLTQNVAFTHGDERQLSTTTKEKYKVSVSLPLLRS